MVENAGAEDEPAHEVGALERDQESDGRAVRVPEQGGGSADDPFEEGDRVLGHDVIGDGAVDVGCAAVAATVGAKHAEMLSEHGHVLLKGP